MRCSACDKLAGPGLASCPCTVDLMCTQALTPRPARVSASRARRIQDTSLSSWPSSWLCSQSPMHQLECVMPKWCARLIGPRLHCWKNAGKASRPALMSRLLASNIVSPCRDCSRCLACAMTALPSGCSLEASAAAAKCRNSSSQ